MCVANLHIHQRATRHPTVVCRRVDLTRSELTAAAAHDGAVTPVCPCSLNAVNRAILNGTWCCFHEHRARHTTPSRQNCDRAHTHGVSRSARLRALGLRAPARDGAVDRAGISSARFAVSQNWASQTSAHGWRCYLSEAIAITTAACGGAYAPITPRHNRTVDRTEVLIAFVFFDEMRAWIPAVGGPCRRGQNRARTVALTAAAQCCARAPRCPI